MMTKIFLLIILVYFISVLFCCFLMIRAKVSEINHLKILDAIFKYQKHFLTPGVFLKDIPDDQRVEFDDMESFEATMWRFWDFGCTRILPKEKYKLVESFIEKKSN